MEILFRVSCNANSQDGVRRAISLDQGLSCDQVDLDFSTAAVEMWVSCETGRWASVVRDHFRSRNQVVMTEASAFRELCVPHRG